MSESSKLRWSKSVRKGEEYKSVEVEQVENGFIITLSMDGKDSEGHYKYECKKFISDKNPLEKEEPVKGSKDLKKMLSSLAEMDGDLIV